MHSLARASISARVQGMKRLTMAMALLVALPGCAFLKNLFLSAFKRPSLSFRQLSLADAALSGITVNTHWTLENPNPLGLSLAEVDYAFFVEDKQVLAGKPPRGLKIAANGQSELVFPANVKFSDIAPLVHVFLNQDYARYRAEGHIGVDTPIGILKLPLSTSGQFEVPKVPSVQVASVRVRNLSFQGALLELPLQLTNRNSFELPIQGVSGQLSIGGATVGTVSTGDLGPLGGRASKQVVIPVQLNFLAAPAAAKAIASGQGQLSLNGQVHSGTAAVPFNLNQLVSFLR